MSQQCDSPQCAYIQEFLMTGLTDHHLSAKKRKGRGTKGMRQPVTHPPLITTHTFNKQNGYNKFKYTAKIPRPNKEDMKF